jgi:hypothetical protein
MELESWKGLPCATSTLQAKRVDKITGTGSMKHQPLKWY